MTVRGSHATIVLCDAMASRLFTVDLISSTFKHSVSKFSTATNHEISTHEQDDRWHKGKEHAQPCASPPSSTYARGHCFQVPNHVCGDGAHMQHSTCVHAHAQHKEDIHTFGTEMLVGSALPPMTTTATTTTTTTAAAASTTTMTTMAERRTVRSPLLPPTSALYARSIFANSKFARCSHRQFTSEVVRKLVGCCERIRTGGVRSQSRGSLALVVDRGTARTQAGAKAASRLTLT